VAMPRDDNWKGYWRISELIIAELKPDWETKNYDQKQSKERDEEKNEKDRRKRIYR
jgi:hypothetical protein